MSVILAPALALMLAQAQTEAVPPPVIGTVPTPNAELDAAYACLRAGLAERLGADAPAPAAEERWGWAIMIADKCMAQINAAADSPQAVRLYGEVSHGTITPRQMLRTEALYFLDRMIREHYEAQS